MDDGGCNLIDFPSIKEKKIEDLHLENLFGLEFAQILRTYMSNEREGKV